MVMKHAVLHLLLASIFWGSPGCSKRPAREASTRSAAASQPVVHPDNLGFHYPPARWRLATLDALDGATLWVAHIAIRHESSEVELFRPPGWRPDPPNPKRSIAEALALAEKVQAQAALAPQKFEQLARGYSEDVASKDQGGMLGGVRASQLVNSDFLDALTVLKPGEVSKAFRTPYGFHIIKRYPPPPDEQLAGERIVIGYEGVYGLATESHRTRAQALQLANEVALQAKKAPRTFRVLVDRYSENSDRAAHGDMGVFSTRDPGYFPAEVQVLASLKVGEVAGPVEGRFGFEILQRAPVVPGKEYAMTAIELRADGEPGDRDTAMAETLKAAEGILGQLRAAPGRFQEFQRNYCCDRVQRWTMGRGDRGLSDALDRLSFGEIAREPIPRPAGYMLMKRLDPSTSPPAPRQFDVPDPADPDYDDLAVTFDQQQLVAATRSFIGAVRDTSTLGPAAVKTIAGTLEELASYFEHNPVDHVSTHATLRTTLASLETALGHDQFDKFKAFGRRWIIRQMMPPGSVD